MAIERAMVTGQRIHRESIDCPCLPTIRLERDDGRIFATIDHYPTDSIRARVANTQGGHP